MSKAESHGAKKKHSAPHGGGHEEGHEGAPEWLISFADNTALIMGFFVIMLALNMMPKGGGDSDGESSGGPTAAQLDWALSVREGFNNPVRIDSTEPRDQLLVGRLKERAMGEGLEQGPRGQGQKLQSLRPTDYHEIAGKVFFAQNSDALTDQSLLVLDDLSQRIRGLRLVVDVRGNTSAAEAAEHGDMGMKLSHDRAVAVAKALVDRGVKWEQLRLISMGKNDRVKLRAYTEEEQLQNQRVEIVVTSELAQEP